MLIIIVLGFYYLSAKGFILAYSCKALISYSVSCAWGVVVEDSSGCNGFVFCVFYARMNMLPRSNVDLIVDVNLLTELNAILFTESILMFAVIIVIAICSM